MAHRVNSMLHCRIKVRAGTRGRGKVNKDEGEGEDAYGREGGRRRTRAGETTREKVRVRIRVDKREEGKRG